MPKDHPFELQVSHKGVTPDLLSDRAGLALFMRYMDRSSILDQVTNSLAKYRHSHKGISIGSLLRQTYAFIGDGSSRHLTYFDHLKKDPGYAGLIETSPFDMASSP